MNTELTPSVQRLLNVIAILLPSSPENVTYDHLRTVQPMLSAGVIMSEDAPRTDWEALRAIGDLLSGMAEGLAMRMRGAA